MIKNNLHFIILCFAGWSLTAQNISYGDQSPIIHGVQNSVKYHNNEKTTVKLPPEVIPLLSGILIMNNADPKSKSFQNGMNAWIEKYTLLKQKIDLLKDVTLKNLCLKQLADGNFPEIEKIIQSKSTYKELQQFFPASYQTIGDQSPIMVGDNSTVTYVINKIIEYKLPESVTKNILDRVYIQDKKIESLTVRLSDRDRAIESWISQYKRLELELRNSPDSINQFAWRFFHQGKLDSALMEVNRAQKVEGTLSQISYLKAQIQILKFKFADYESSFSEINKNFQIAALLDEKNIKINYSYAQFYSEFSIDNIKKIEVLENVYKNIPEDSIHLKYKICLDLSDAYAVLQRNLPAVQYLEYAVKFAHKYKNEVGKAEVLFFIHVAYSRIFGQTNQIAEKILHCDSALLICAKYPSIKEKNKRYWYVAKLNKIVDRVTTSNDREAGMLAYRQILNEAEKDLELSASNELFLFERYIFLGNQYASIGKWETAKAMLADISNKIRPLITPKGRLYFQIYYNNWLTLLSILAANGRYTEWEQELNVMDNMLTQLSSIEPDLYLESKARLDFEYGVYMLAHKNYDGALGKFRTNLTFLIQNLSKNPEGFSIPTTKCIGSIGECYANLFKPAEGVSYLKSQIVIINKIQYLDDKNYTFSKINIYRQIGNLFQLDGKVDSARYYMQKALFEAESRLTASNDAFLYDFISLSYDHANTYLTFDNSRAISVVKKAKDKIVNYSNINTDLHQKYLPDLAYVTTYTAHIYTISRDYTNACKNYLEAHNLYSSIAAPNIHVRYMYASFLVKLSDFFDSADYFFPELSKKQAKEVQINKCKYSKEAQNYLQSLPDDSTKANNLSRLARYLQTCK